VLIVTLSAFLTPGDFVWSTLALSVPLYCLYEMSVAVSFIVWRKRARTDTVSILLAPLIALHALSRRTARPRPA
jgi:Sec-independent protein secretion pathway component TatC